MREYLSRLRSTDWVLNLAIFSLLLFGLAAIYSVALSQEGSDFLNLKKQLIAAAIGVVFFIFLVCNAGGLLTPIGDPPLFLGYLRGIDFFLRSSIFSFGLVLLILSTTTKFLL